MELKVNQDNCLGCGICVIACPVNAALSPENAGGSGAKTEEVIMMVENGFIKLFSPEKCEKCGTLIHVDCECIGELTNHILVNHEFILNKEHIIINGICKKCNGGIVC